LDVTQSISRGSSRDSSRGQDGAPESAEADDAHSCKDGNLAGSAGLDTQLEPNTGTASSSSSINEEAGGVPEATVDGEITEEEGLRTHIQELSSHPHAPIRDDDEKPSADDDASDNERCGNDGDRIASGTDAMPGSAILPRQDASPPIDDATMNAADCSPVAMAEASPGAGML